MRLSPEGKAVSALQASFLRRRRPISLFLLAAISHLRQDARPELTIYSEGNAGSGSSDAKSVPVHRNARCRSRHSGAVHGTFALVVLCTTVIAFPLLLDRDTGAAVAIHTSMTAFAGLAVVIPVLGHATWHLYRKIVETEPMPRPRGARGP
jgi:hypothetical protein